MNRFSMRHKSSPMRSRWLSHSPRFGAANRAIRSPQALLRRADELLAISTEHGFPLFSSLGTIFRGWCLSALGQIEEGASLLSDGLSKHRASGAALYTPFGITLLSDAYGRSRGGQRRA